MIWTTKNTLSVKYGGGHEKAVFSFSRVKSIISIWDAQEISKMLTYMTSFSWVFDPKGFLQQAGYRSLND